MDKKKVTFADIAKYTGFSKTTVSRYFNNPDSLTLENQEKIASALETLGYQENKLAKVLANGKSEFVGIIIPTLYLHYYSAILNELLTSYRNYHYKFLVFVSNSQKETEENYIKELLAYKIEGLIVLSHTLSSAQLAACNIPVVAIEREAEHICGVTTDNYMGAMQATSLLIKNGCEILIHINAPVPEQIPSHLRIQAFEDVCLEHRVNHVLITERFGDSYEEMHRQLKTIFQQIDTQYPRLKKGIFLANDTYASIFLNLIFQKYGRLPEDYRIVGFDNSPISSEGILPISTVGQQIDKIAQTAMELLVSQMEERKKRKPAPLEAPIHKQVTPILIRRETTD